MDNDGCERCKGHCEWYKDNCKRGKGGSDIDQNSIEW